jgi:HSP20 family protein
MERWFNDFWSPLRQGRDWRTQEKGAGLPSVDVDLYEKENEIVAKAELPGLSKEDIQVEVRDHLLTIRGEKRKEEEVHDEDYFYSERCYGTFGRSVELPTDVQTDKAKASFKNGILEIRLPKAEEAKKKQIQVNVE